ncbi:MAG: DUF885 family protein, partial [Pirellulaceae bacterium]
MGTEKFAVKLKLTLDTGRSADEVLEAALREFDRVQRDLYFVAKQLWSRYFTHQVLPPDDHLGRRDTIAKVVQAVSQEHGQPAALIADARQTVSGIRRFIVDQRILELPEIDRCQVIEMPEFRRGNSLAYLESALPLDPQGAS